jgi:hypothetical protein
MKPGSVWLCLLCTWALCNFWLLPLAKNRWNAVNLRTKLARTGSLVVLEKVRDLTAIGTLVITLVILLTWLASLLSATSIGLPQAVIAATASLYDGTKSAGEKYGSALGVIGLLGAVIALYLAARHARQKVSQAWVAKAEEMHTLLREDPSTLAAARTDPDLQPLVGRLDELIGVLVAHDSGEESKVRSNEQIQEIREQIARVLSMLAIEMAQKELKFDELIDKASSDGPQATGLWARLSRAMASERFGKDLGFVKKPLSYVTTGLLVVSLLGWSAEPLANSLQLAVNNLRVNVLDKQAERELSEAISKAPERKPEPPGDAASESSANASAVAHTAQTAARLVARAAVNEMSRDGALDRAAQVQRTVSSEAEFVRNAINEQHIDAALSSDTVGKVRQEVSELVAKNAQDGSAAASKAQEAIERELAPNLERFKNEHPSRFQLWAHALEQRYATPMGAVDAQGKLLAQMLDEAFSAVDAKPTTELGKQAQRLVKDFGKDSVKTWAQSWAKTWVTDSIIEGVKPELHARVRDFAFEASTDTRRFVDDLVAAEGRGWANSVERQQDAKVVRAVAEQVASLHEPELQAALRERLGGYDELFPKDSPNFPEGVGGGGGGGGGHGDGGPGKAGGGAHANASGKVGFAQARATSFKLASRSFRVRGVLIGQDMQISGVRLNGIQWSLQPRVADQTTKIAIRVRQENSWRDLGIFDAGVVNQALRYASDRRVVATTITPGDGKVVGRITYLHPVLADTPLGCRIVESDRLIDTFTFAKKGEKPAAALASIASDRAQMGEWMLIVRLTEALATVPTSRSCPREELDKLMETQKVGSVRFTPNLQATLNDFISKEEKKLPGSTRIVAVAQSCSGTEPSKLAGCLCDKAKSIGLPSSYWYPEDHTSQFRERAVTAGPDWAWMQRSPSRLGNVDLWVHTTFSLRKSNSRGSELDEATASSVDFPQADLQALRQQVTDQLPQYVHDTLASPSYDDFMSPVEDFIVLQRLFRSTLAGGFGSEFPVAELVRLERVTRQFVPQQPTIRWEPAASKAQLLETLKQADSAAAKSYQRWNEDMVGRITAHRPVCDRVSG